MGGGLMTKSDLAADILRALATLTGVGMVGYGAWLHYPPLGFLASGSLLAAMGLIGTLRAR